MREPSSNRTGRRLLAVGIAVVLAGGVAACGDDDEDGGAVTTTTAGAPATTTTAAPTTTGDDGATTTTGGASETTTTVPAALEQPAVWPAAGSGFDTPDAAAEAFVTEALGVPAELGEFMQGDSRSGEIEVFSPGEGDAGTPVPRGLLLLRQLGPDSAWYVLAAVNDVVTIESPESQTEVPAGPVTVSGVGTGFEANLVVTAFPAGDAGTVLDQAVTMAGNFGEPAPYEVELDLRGAEPGSVVTLLARGGTGLETDPGEFAAIPVVISGG